MSSEQLRTLRRERFAADDDGDNDDAASGLVTVINGVYAHELPVANQTVGIVRAAMGERFHIAPDALAVVDGQPVGEDTILVEGQALTFVKHAGERGLCHV